MRGNTHAETIPRTCPVCGRPNLKNLSTHLLKVHGLVSRERQHFLKHAQVSSWHPSPYPEKPRTTGEKSSPNSEHSPSAKKPRVVRAMTTKHYPEFNFRHKFSLLVVGPSESGKTYFVQQILENNRIAYEEKRSIRILCCYNQWQDLYDDLKKPLGKASGLREVCQSWPTI